MVQVRRSTAAKSPALTPAQAAKLWHRDDPADPIEEDNRDPFILEMNDQEASKIRKGNPYLWAQLIDRGFIDHRGRGSRAWIDDPRNRPIKQR